MSEDTTLWTQRRLIAEMEISPWTARDKDMLSSALSLSLSPDLGMAAHIHIRSSCISRTGKVLHGTHRGQAGYP